jgi:hypothetical protein
MQKTILASTAAIVLIILGLLGFSVLKRPNKIPIADYTNKIHAPLFAEADGFWNDQLAPEPFRPVLINDEQHGSATFLRLTWSKPEQQYNQFVITLTQPESGWRASESREGDGNSLDVSGLMPDTKYVVNIQACLDSSCEHWLNGQDELVTRTEKLYVQLTPDQVDQPETDEELIQDVRMNQVILLDENSVVLEADQRNAYEIIGRFENKDTSYLQLSQDKEIFFAKILNR